MTTGLPLSPCARSGVSMPASLARSFPECTRASSTLYSAPSSHQRRWRASSSGSSTATFTQPRTPYEPATRPNSIRFSGCFFALAKLLHEPHHRGREPRALAFPVLDALDIHAQRLASLGRLRIVEADALEETPGRRAARFGHYQVIEGALVRAAARQSNDNHFRDPVPCEK